MRVKPRVIRELLIHHLLIVIIQEFMDFAKFIITIRDLIVKEILIIRQIFKDFREFRDLPI